MRRAIKQIVAFGIGVYLIISGLLDGDYIVSPIMGFLLVCWAVLDILSEKNHKFYIVARIFGSAIGAAIAVYGIVGAIHDYDIFFVILMILGAIVLLSNLLPIVMKRGQNYE